jgi:S1-C subfamily serine protease
VSEYTEEVAEHQRDHMLDKENVVGIAGGEDELLVLVTEKKPLDELDEDDVVEREVEGVTTDVIEVGDLRPMLKAGDSIGLGNAGTGTFGGVVQDEHGNLYALTNNHVAANSNKARVLEAIHHPGPADGLGGRVGVLARFEPIFFDRENLIDAALVRLDRNQGVEVIHEAKTTTARIGWTVQKFGRTTGHTYGKVIGRNATVDVGFGTQGVARFVNQVITDKMLSPGDSGSVLLSTSRHPIALGFAGSDTISIHTPINLVLRTLGVRFLRPLS